MVWQCFYAVLTPALSVSMPIISARNCCGKFKSFSENLYLHKSQGNGNRLEEKSKRKPLRYGIAGRVFGDKGCRNFKCSKGMKRRGMVRLNISFDQALLHPTSLPQVAKETWEILVQPRNRMLFSTWKICWRCSTHSSPEIPIHSGRKGRKRQKNEKDITT